MSRRALAPVAGCGEATKPGLAPIGSLNQQPPWEEKGLGDEEVRVWLGLIYDVGTRARVDAFYLSVVPLQLNNFVRVLFE